MVTLVAPSGHVLLATTFDPTVSVPNGHRVDCFQSTAKFSGHLISANTLVYQHRKRILLCLKSVLPLTLMSGHFLLPQALVKHCADTQVRNMRGQTPLDVARASWIGSHCKEKIAQVLARGR